MIQSLRRRHASERLVGSFLVVEAEPRAADLADLLQIFEDVGKRRVRIPSFLHNSFTATPASACFNTPTICCSVNRDFFIRASLTYHRARKLYFQTVYISGELTVN